jgi:lipid-binding SYLF domain-containing protein
MKPILTMVASLFALAFIAGCATSQTSTGWDPSRSATPSEQPARNVEVANAIANFKNSDPGMNRFFDNAHGYAIFPTVGKGGAFVGGAYGTGEVYERGRLIGRSSITQLTLGLQLGGQAYSEIIFFKDKASLDDFRLGNFEFGAQASAVAVTAGASANAGYSNGVAVFTLAKGGLMYEATIAGQKFNFTPVN